MLCRDHHTEGVRGKVFLFGARSPGSGLEALWRLTADDRWPRSYGYEKPAEGGLLLIAYVIVLDGALSRRRAPAGRATGGAHVLIKSAGPFRFR